MFCLPSCITNNYLIIGAFVIGILLVVIGSFMFGGSSSGSSEVSDVPPTQPTTEPVAAEPATEPIAAEESNDNLNQDEQ